jgi:hypothetical protein
MFSFFYLLSLSRKIAEASRRRGEETASRRREEETASRRREEETASRSAEKARKNLRSKVKKNMIKKTFCRPYRQRRKKTVFLIFFFLKCVPGIICYSYVATTFLDSLMRQLNFVLLLYRIGDLYIARSSTCP